MLSVRSANAIMKKCWSDWKAIGGWMVAALCGCLPPATAQDYNRPIVTNGGARDMRPFGSGQASAGQSGAGQSGSGSLAKPTLNPFPSSNPSAATVEWRSRDEQYAQLSEEVTLLERQTQLLRKAVRLVNPTVVHIEATKEEGAMEGGLNANRPDARNAKNESRRVEEAGSGVVVVIGQSNFVITNRHVIQSAALQNIRIETYEGVPLKVTQVWEDPSTDLAVIDVSRRDLPAARIGDCRTLEMGDHVFAVGSPFGLNHSVSYGIVSAKGRRNLELGSKSIVYQDFIQTDAAINPGNSGGPLMNMRGEVVGINTAIASNSGGNEGIGFSIPINIAMNVATQLVERGSLQKSYLGVSVERAFNLDAGIGVEAQRPRGAFVKVIKPNSPAEVAGLRYGDIILEFDGTSVENDEHLVQLVGLSAIGRPIEVIVLRETSRLRIPVELVASPAIH
jgi:serine protease Do